MFWIFLVFSLALAEAARYECNFNQDACGFKNTGSDKDFSWDRESGRMSVKAPWYHYGKAILSVKLDLFEKTCISFNYFVLRSYGYAKLSLYVNGIRRVTIYGKSHCKWQRKELRVTGCKGSHREVRFEGSIKKSYHEAIKIDNVKIYDCDNPHPTPHPPCKPICGKGPSKDTRIVGGTTAKPNSWPHQCQIRFTSDDFPFCGASLISKDFVLTAAHCIDFDGVLPSDIYVRCGAHNRVNKTTGYEQDLQVAKVIKHCDYSYPNTFYNDIALIKLKKPAVLNDKVSPVCLPDGVTDAPTENTTCWITGWGTLSFGGAVPDELQQAQVPIVGPKRCKASYGEYINPSMTCAGLDQGGVDACQGDSGGPLVCETGGRYYLHGATSWGFGCAFPRYYGVYAGIKYLSPWIRNEMFNN